MRKARAHFNISVVIDEMHAYFRDILVRNLAQEQLELFDTFSANDPLIQDAADEEFPMFDGLPEFDDITNDELECEDDGLSDEEPEDEYDEEADY